MRQRTVTLLSSAPKISFFPLNKVMKTLIQKQDKKYSWKWSAAPDAYIAENWYIKRGGLTSESVNLGPTFRSSGDFTRKHEKPPLLGHCVDFR